MEEANSQKAEIKSETQSKALPWKFFTVVLAIVVVILLIIVFKGGVSGNVISQSSASDKLVGYLNQLTNGGVTYISAKDAGSMYEVTVSYKNDSLPVYITKDGKYFVQGAVEIPVANSSSSSTGSTETTNAPKSDKPKVELFVMTYCPYGTQAEKGLIPVLESLGSKIDAQIRFVHYFMHGEKEENETYTQVCIREEQSSKFLPYLKCFLNASDSAQCLKDTKIDMAKLNTCLTNKAKDYYAADSALSNGYGVQGSPTLVINGQQVSSARNPQAFLTAVCSAFNTSPSECSKQLSTENPSAGFGYTASASSSTASCG
jgi:protein-disulfide isomerase